MGKAQSLMTSNIVNITDIINSLEEQVNKRKLAYNLSVDFGKECIHIVLYTKYGTYIEEDIYFSFQKENKEFIDYAISECLWRLNDKTFSK